MTFHTSPATAAGLKNERRFADAIGDYHSHEPAWFLGLDEASPLLDLRGIDFLAWVKYPNRRRPMPVPVQIKSSEEGRDRYYEKHPAAKDARVVVMVLRRGDSPGTLRGRFFNELGKVRTEGVEYEDYLEKLLCRKVNLRGAEKLRGIEEQRRSATHRAHAPAPREPNRRLQLHAPELTSAERLYHRARAFIRRLFAPRKRPHKTERKAA